MTTSLHRAAVSLTLCLVLVLGVGLQTGCFVQEHQVGAGGSGATSVEHRQWFALWGLVPITEIDTEATVGDAQNYTLRSEFTPLDIVIGIFTGIVTVQPKTITVVK